MGEHTTRGSFTEEGEEGAFATLPVRIVFSFFSVTRFPVEMGYQQDEANGKSEWQRCGWVSAFPST